MPQATQLPTEPVDRPSYDDTKAVEFGHGCNAVYAESGASIDAGMISVYSQRCAFDYYAAGVPWETAMREHINGLRLVYGLPSL